MINIEREDLKHYDKIGFGKFGSVYYVDGKIAYKIYHEYTKDIEGFSEVNPAIFHVKRRIEKLKKKKDKLEYTAVPEDYIIINGKIGGIVIPYYDGCVLNKLKDANYQLKKNITNQLLKSH